MMMHRSILHDSVKKQIYTEIYINYKFKKCFIVMLHHKVIFRFFFIFLFCTQIHIDILVWHDNLFIFSNDYNKEKYKIILDE